MLNGLSTAPQPKGPYKIGGAKPAPIDFKNPFFDAVEFTVRLDNPAFTTAVKNPVKIEVNTLQTAFKSIVIHYLQTSLGQEGSRHFHLVQSYSRLIFQRKASHSNRYQIKYIYLYSLFVIPLSDKFDYPPWVFYL